jgi:hypothetical protein
MREKRKSDDAYDDKGAGVIIDKGEGDKKDEG